MLPETEYYEPTDIESACQLLSETNGTVLAGGQSLGLLTKEGLVTPDVLVDINGINELEGIDDTGEHLRLGATTTHRTVETSPVVGESLPVLQEAAKSIADVQIRNAGTIGGVVAFSDPTAEYPIVLLALDGAIHTRTADEKRVHDARDFFTGYYQNRLNQGELVTEIRLPVLGGGEGAGYRKFAYRENDRAVVNVVSYVALGGGTCKAARIAIGSVTDRPVLADGAAEQLVGTDLADEDLDVAATTASEEVPIDPDPSVSRSYRSSLVETLTRKTLETAREKATQGR